MSNPYTAAFDVVADTENGYLVPDDLVREIVDAALAAAGDDLDAIRLQAQIRYLKSSLISAEMLARDIKGTGPDVTAKIERIIGGIEGNMEVVAHKAVERALRNTAERKKQQNAGEPR